MEKAGDKRMKRKLYALCAVAALLLLSACGAQKKPAAMELMRAELSKEEQDLFTLVSDGHTALFDFALDEPAAQVVVQAYRLSDDGEWQPTGGGGIAFEEKAGRLVLSFDRIAEGFRIAIQGQQGTVGSKNEAPTHEKGPEQAIATGFASGPVTKLVWEEEIPLALEIAATGDISISCSTELYFRPGDLTGQGYDEVYAVTLMFSKEPLT